MASENPYNLVIERVAGELKDVSASAQKASKKVIPVGYQPATPAMEAKWFASATPQQRLSYIQQNGLEKAKEVAQRAMKYQQPQGIPPADVSNSLVQNPGQQGGIPNA